MGGDPKKEPPFYFTKPADAVVDLSCCSSTIPYPTKTSNLHFEAELVVAMGLGGTIFGYAVGCDLTRRDLQKQAKDARRPWDLSKGFDYSAPCGPLIETEDLDTSMILSLSVNGEPKQQASLDEMVWSVPDTVSILGEYVELRPGDLIMTGTPAGVGPLEIGDSVKIACGGLPPCEFQMG